MLTDRNSQNPFFHHLKIVSKIIGRNECESVKMKNKRKLTEKKENCKLSMQQFVSNSHISLYRSGNPPLYPKQLKIFSYVPLNLLAPNENLLYSS